MMDRVEYKFTDMLMEAGIFVCAFIGIFLLMFIVLSWIFLGTVVWGWGFELTPEQIDDEQKTQFCIVYNISNEECFLVYGDTQSNWEPKH